MDTRISHQKGTMICQLHLIPIVIRSIFYDTDIFVILLFAWALTWIGMFGVHAFKGFKVWIHIHPLKTNFPIGAIDMLTKLIREFEINYEAA